jgi:hypothetical protein
VGLGDNSDSNSNNSLFLFYEKNHRVDRALGFFSSRRNWDPPIASPAGDCAPPPPPLFLGEGYIRLREWEWSQFGRGDRHCGTPGIYVLCEKN